MKTFGELNIGDELYSLNDMSVSFGTVTKHKITNIIKGPVFLTFIVDSNSEDSEFMAMPHLSEGMFAPSIEGVKEFWKREYQKGIEAQNVEIENIKETIKDMQASLNKIVNATEMNFVDLGLPSGTLWADRNVCANIPIDSGNYYTFSDTNKLGVVPTKEQFEELLENCEYAFVKKDGVKGGLFNSKINGNSIFFPAAGYRSDLVAYDVSSGVYCWSSSVKSAFLAYSLYFDSDDTRVCACYRGSSQSVRLVK